jgi:hypothetical protein
LRLCVGNFPRGFDGNFLPLLPELGFLMLESHGFTVGYFLPLLRSFIRFSFQSCKYAAPTR